VDEDSFLHTPSYSVFVGTDDLRVEVAASNTDLTVGELPNALIVLATTPEVFVNAPPL
jgi:hypothetical protein